MAMIDVQAVKAKTDLLALAQRDTALRRMASTCGGEWAGPCPFCGGRDRFRVQPRADGGARWLCRNCTSGEWQDAIAYVMRRGGCDFLKACELLEAGGNVSESFRPASVSFKRAEPTSKKWQAQARQAMENCERNLWADAGHRAREWLHRRGLGDSTLRRWRLGYLPGKPNEWRKVAGLSVPCGIVIPGLVENTLWYLKVRRVAGHPKYAQVRGSAPALFGAETLRGQSVALLCEGEFDAMLLAQEAGDLVGVATLGSAASRLDVALWGDYLLPMGRLLVAYDLDRAGQQGAHKLTDLTARARRVRVPALPGIKDITDFYTAGGNVRAWLTFELARLTPPVNELAVAANRHLEAEAMAILDEWGADPQPDHRVYARRYADAAIATGLLFYSGGIGILVMPGDGTTVLKAADVPYDDDPRNLGASGWDGWADEPLTRLPARHQTHMEPTPSTNEKGRGP